MNILITGASGFTGRAMIRFLASKGNVRIAGLARKNDPSLIRSSRVSWYFTDIHDPEPLTKVVTSAEPDAVLHLAGLTHGTLPELRAANVDGTRNVLDAIHQANPCPVLVISSSAVYGFAGTAPIPEEQTLTPVSDYGTSKVEQEAVCQNYMRSGHGAIAIARPFNLIGPGQPDSFVCGRIIRQVIEMEKKTRSALDLLETGSFRDFIDVRDVVEGYWSILSHPDFSAACSGKIFNLGSGNPRSITDVIQIIGTLTGVQYPVRLPDKPVPVLVPYQKSDNSRIESATGWKPAISLQDSLSDMLTAAQEQAFHTP